MKQSTRHLVIAIIISAYIIPLVAMDTSHFYRAHPPFWHEPRFEEPWLSSTYIDLMGGSTSCSFNNCGKKTSLLNLYGPHKLQFLGQNLPGIDPTNSLDQILLHLAALPVRHNFASLAFSGRFSLWEAQFNMYQNFCKGFFLHINIPVRTLQLQGIHMHDLTPDDGIFPNRSTPEWQEFLQSFPAILHRYHLRICPVSETNIGDMSILGGWTVNHEDTEYLDFIDATIQAGVLIPTGRTRNIHHIFDIPSGYNGHVGCSIIFDASVGAYEWLTVGYHSAGLFLFDKTQTRFMKTAPETNGFINLACGKAKVSPGTYWQVGMYLKADHFCGGGSFLLGYIFDLAEKTCLAPCKTIFQPAIVNTDSLLKKWLMHTLNVSIEYDFAREDRPNAPYIAFTYSHVLGGKRIFDNSTVGGTIGIDISWCF